MTNDEPSVGLDESGHLDVRPPVIWPEARFHALGVRYSSSLPTGDVLAEGDLISGLLVGAADHTIGWLHKLLQRRHTVRICLVLVLYPDGPTRREHLEAFQRLREVYAGAGASLQVRLMPQVDRTDGDCRWPMLPPTVVQTFDRQTGRTVMSIGSSGDMGVVPLSLASLNVVFHPDDATRDAWRRWFQYVFDCAAPLNERTAQIPHLVPVQGDPEAASLWRVFEMACFGTETDTQGPEVDSKTGEVTCGTPDQPVVSWDEGMTALEPLAQILQHVYASGWLVTVDEGTRIKPLTVPVKAALLGQRGERTVGAVKQKQSFSLKVLDDAIDREIEKCRRVSDLLELLTYPLSQGVRWVPESARALLEQELERRDNQGHDMLKHALGGRDAEAFVAVRLTAIQRDLDAMYKELGREGPVPTEQVEAVLKDIEQRLTQALTARITPSVTYNRVAPPELAQGAEDGNWNQPFTLLECAARTVRKSYTDFYFPRRLSGTRFSLDEFRKALDIFGDHALGGGEGAYLEQELQLLDEISTSDKLTRDKCLEVWRLTKGLPS